MPTQERQRPPIVCLWGGHRPCPDLDCHLTPSNADKGARELKARGYSVQSISPWMHGRRRMSSLERKAQYVARVGMLLRAARAPDSVIYTSDLPWIRLLGLLKRSGLLRRRVVTHWGGYDFDPESLPVRAYRERYRRLFAPLDAIWVASEHERRVWTTALPELEVRMAYHPMFVDLGFYRSVVPSALVHDVVAMGSDSRRNWEIPIGLAAGGLRVAIVTEDAEVRRRVLALPPQVRNNITLAYQSGFQQSARIASAGRCMLVATPHNHRISGSTTLSVAIALGKPLVIDDPFDLPAYGVHRGIHCETFERGDIASARLAVGRILNSSSHASALGAAIATRRDLVDINAFADRLEASLHPDWTASMRPSTATVESKRQPDTVAAWP
jgi:hypothetical protein